jgi:hypothetical protein
VEQGDFSSMSRDLPIAKDQNLPVRILPGPEDHTV